MLFIFPNKIISFVTLFSTNKDRDGYAGRERPSALHKRSLPYNDKSCYIQVLRICLDLMILDEKLMRCLARIFLVI